MVINSRPTHWNSPAGTRQILAKEDGNGMKLVVIGIGMVHKWHGHFSNHHLGKIGTDNKKPILEQVSCG